MCICLASCVNILPKKSRREKQEMRIRSSWLLHRSLVKLRVFVCQPRAHIHTFSKPWFS